jgi:predicted dehydrogenase
MKMLPLSAGLAVIGLVLAACSSPNQPAAVQSKKVRLLTLDPGHFHAALVQKKMYPQIDSVVSVYAPPGPDVQEHLKRIETYNTRPGDPTRWQENVYTGTDFLEKLIEQKPGNLVVISGNNQKKSEYIQASVNAGLHVLADKPMCIDSAGFERLKESFATANQKNVLLYDIMTERSEITTVLQKELSQVPAIFGKLQTGTEQEPAVTKESVHNFYKYVSGKVLKRPDWFMDVAQQGEGLVDVTTHLVDLVQWECFPEQVIDYQKDIALLSARRWPTQMTRSQFATITGTTEFPEFLRKNLQSDTVLGIFANGEINYKIKDVHAKVSVTWNYRAPEGAGDTHYSIMRGTAANLIIRQGAEEKYVPQLYIEPASGADAGSYEKALAEAFKVISQKYKGVTLEKHATGWRVQIPDSYRNGHEAHFAEVMERFLHYLDTGQLPAWEQPNMLAKYYTTTQALRLAKTTSAPAAKSISQATSF